MQSWPAPGVPHLAGSGTQLRMYDTATGQVRPVVTGPTATMYVCGITPYDATHLGHAFTYLTFDLLQRQWRANGLGVNYVQNVTDIDDPLLERAIARGEDWHDIALRETELFRHDMTALRVVPPQHYLGAIESIPSIVTYIEQLLLSGAVYQVEEDLYFDLTASPRFGEVSRWTEEHMLAVCAERGGDPERAGKRHPLDPLMWRAKRSEEPAWDTALGHGRPGWHIECVAIALDHLGMSFDVQGGGNDLVFPHHEMGAAHAEAITASWPYARHYVHVGMVGYEGHKMSKSRGNLVFVSRLLSDGVNPNDLRLSLINHHYRHDWEWTSAELTAATQRREVWEQAAASGHTSGAAHTIAQVRDALSDDLDAPRALAMIDTWAATALTRKPGPPDDGQAMITAVDALLGVVLAPV
ncbi:MAG: cysteine--1-D-myo-inosityl 2-amino-2-deoxy-alpha-D-glucopyranoside ligase [Candidatus Nanopelagicales bacterium]|jgi:L-cysteine:1D-myo-inositol 2-amino-2-deoxy-alpha-D-glucopyranoside ligase|nr:cysteine--1-D-myo-inosityl 2-amino-2-deoxy-alpha-D-glucopyranoside ligase [Candidatus Nanopelagicales bacterium]MDP4824965.1 cysteine--1-D-myo-inosityl 2-amino-2-deoxy-alpha-D-glucopyranoside ligase [Candidatus Nanopelagicales bacterium]MDP4887711.1 cysteine--1-D-myo-inosityl 2-amino-2-deoxy-alpha-D-glucopyranoside ligase [Candidatus Nanopelagicales bacterium]